MRRLLVALLFASPVLAQHATFSPQAAAFIFQMAEASRTTLVEVGGCVTKYHYNGDTVVVQEVESAQYDSSDWKGIYKRHGSMCHGKQPHVHTHLVDYNYFGHSVYENYPSCSDSLVQQKYGEPFDLVIDVRLDSSHTILHVNNPNIVSYDCKDK